MRTPNERQRVRACVATALLACLGSCQLVDGLARERGSWSCAADPAFIAWVAASIARDHFPDADPTPHPTALPVLAHGQGENRWFEVFAMRNRGGLGRMRANGRLQATHLPLQQCCEQPQSHTVTFREMAAPMVAVDAGTHRLRVRVWRDSEGATQVRIFARGESVAAVRQLGTAIRVATAIHHIQRTTSNDSITRIAALRRLQSEIGENGAPCRQTHQMIGWIEVCLGRTHAERGRVAAARAALRRALDRDPSWLDVRSLVASLDLRAARPDQSIGELGAVAMSASAGPASLLAAGHFGDINVLAAARAGGSPAPQARAMAARRLAAGDVESAVAWTLRAIHTAESGNMALELAADIIERMGQPSQAITVQMAALADLTPDSDMVLRACARLIQHGRPIIALRTLSRHWSLLQEDQENRERADRTLKQLSERVGAAWAARIALGTTGMPDLQTRQTRRLLRSGRGSRSGTALFARIPNLRRRAEPPVTTENGFAEAIDDGWYSAPGVTPGR